MAGRKTAVVVGGSQGIGLAVAQALAARGEAVVVTSRDQRKAESAARSVGHGATTVVVDLTRPQEIAKNFAAIGPVDHLVITAIERDRNTVKAFDIEAAIKTVTTKLVGYTEVAHVLAERFTSSAAIVLYGGMARERPYPGSTVVSPMNGGITALVRALAVELAPVRVNAIHPGFVSDSPYWAGNAQMTALARSRTPGGRLLTTADCVGATLFLLDNEGMNGANLTVDVGIGLSLS
jgi:NAD(P)-dependent dehydrogenase (short-subunit alcohol dehydrogenase family)